MVYRAHDNYPVRFLSLLIGLAVGCAFIPTGCRHPPPKVKVANPPQSASGEASFTTLVDPADTPNLPKNKSFQWARAQGPLAMPVYPPNALKSKVGPVTVAVRIVIDVDGKVASIIDSPL